MRRASKRLAVSGLAAWVLLFAAASPAAATDEPSVLVHQKDIGALGGILDSTADAINAAGQIGGSSRDESKAVHGYIAKDGKMKDLGDSGYLETRVTDVTDRGLVVGYGTDEPWNYPFSAHAYTWTAAEFTALPTLGGSWSIPAGVNVSGAVVGIAAADWGGGYAALWSGGTVTSLHPSDGYLSDAVDINAQGQVTGSSWDGYNTYAYRWESSTLTKIGDDFTDFPYTFGQQINDAGLVSGSRFDSSFAFHAYVWSNGTITMLGDLGGGWSTVADMNEAGKIVGSSPNASGNEHAYLWYNGTMTDLGDLGGGWSSAVDINERGQVVGSSTTGSGATHAFLWTSGTMRDLGDLGGESSWASGVNNDAVVVGSSLTGNGAETLGFVWKSGKMKAMGSLGGRDEHNFAASNAMNENGNVAGTSSTDRGYDHAFYWNGGVSKDIGTLKGGSWSALCGCNPNARGINERGQVIGQADNQSGDEHSFFWENGKITDLGTLGGHYTRAWALNNRGEVAGETMNSDGAVRAFVWRNGTMSDLGTLGGDLSAAYFINDRGTAAGTSFTSDGVWHAFLWSDGTMQQIGPDYSVVEDLNQNDEAIVHSGEDLFLWDGDSLTAVGPWRGDYSVTPLPQLNDDGQMLVTTLGELGDTYDTYLWENGTTTTLASVFTWEAYDSNVVRPHLSEQGQVTGIHHDENGSLTAYLWENGTARDLGSLGGGWALPLGLNNRGWVVGVSSNESGALLPFIWNNGTMSDLGTDEGVSTTPMAINGRGEVLGSTWDGVTPSLTWWSVRL